MAVTENMVYKIDIEDNTDESLKKVKKLSESFQELEKNSKIKLNESFDSASASLKPLQNDLIKAKQLVSNLSIDKTILDSLKSIPIGEAIKKSLDQVNLDPVTKGYRIGAAIGVGITTAIMSQLDLEKVFDQKPGGAKISSMGTLYAEYFVDQFLYSAGQLIISRFPKEVHQSLKTVWDLAYRNFILNLPEAKKMAKDTGLEDLKGYADFKTLPVNQMIGGATKITGPVVNPAISMGIAALTGGFTEEIKKFLDQAQMDKYGNVISSIANNLNGLERPLKNSIDLFSDLTEVIKLLNDPKQVYNISQLLITISDLFAERGQFQLADTILEFSKILESVAIKTEMAKEETNQNFEEMVQGAKSFDATLKTLGTTLGVVAGAVSGARLFEYLRSFDKFKTATDPLINNMLKLKAVSMNVLDFIKTRFHLSFLSATEAVSLLSPAVMLLGDKLKESESNLVKFIGNLLFFVGLVGTGLTGALSFVLSKLGGFIESIGIDMVESLTAATDKFIKFESIMKQFQFTISGFIKTFSVDSIGSLKQWNQVMDEVFQTTVFTRDQIAKSIKMLVAEGQVIGMTFEQNIALLQRITDIAASTGRDLYEVTQMVISGLTNNADATIALGIDIRNTALAHSEYAKKANIAIEQMNQQEIAMARLNVLYERTVPIVGAAKHQVDTIAGATEIYNKTLDDIKIAMGDAGVASQLYLTTMVKIATFFAKLPKPILVLIGNLKDFVGVILILIGKIISLTALLLTAITVFGVLNLVLVKLGYTAISLSGIFSTLLFKIMPFIGAILALATAYSELKKQSEVYKSFMNQIASVFGDADESIVQVEEDIGILAKTVNYFTDVLKVALLGLAQTINYVAEGFVQFKMLFANDEDEKTYQAMLLELEMRTAGLVKESNKLGSSLLFLSESTAMASDSASKMAGNNKENIDLMANLKKRVLEAAKALNEGFDVGIEKQKVLGNEFEKAAASYKQSTMEMENVFKRKSGERELAQRYADLEKASIAASFEIEKLRLDTLKKFNEEIKSIQIDALRKQGRNIEAIKEETKLRLKLLEVQKKGLDLLPGGITKEEISQIEKYKKTIIEAQKASISEERAKQLQKISDLQKQIGEIQRESLGYDQNAILDARAKIESRKEELIQIEKQLKASNDLTIKAKELLQVGRESLDLSYKNNLIKIQKDLAKESLGIEQEIAATYMNQEDILRMQNQIKMDDLNAKIKDMERVKNQGAGEMAITDEYRNQIKLSESLSKIKIYDEQAKALGEMGESAYKISKQLLIGARNIPDKMMVDVEYNQKGEVGSGIFNSLKDSWNKGIKYLASPFDQSIEVLSKISLKFAGAFSTGYTIVDNFVQGIGKIFDPEFIQGIADMLENLIDKLPDALMTAFEALDKVVVKVIDNLPNIISKLMDSLSSIIGRIMEKLPDLINALMDGLVVFLNKLPEITQKIFSALPAILQAFLSKLPEVITALFKAIPQIIKQILDVLPDVITTILDNLPSIIETIITAFLEAVGSIVNFIIDFIIGGGLEKIIKSIIVAIPRIIGAIIMGVIRGLGKFWDALFKGGAMGDFADTVEELPKKMEKGIKNLAKAVAKESSQVFKVLDLEGEAKAVDRLSKAESVTDVLNAATDYLNKKTKGLWDQIIDGLTKMWRWVWDKILGPIVNALREVWLWIYDKIIEPILNGLKEVWLWVYEKVIQPILKGLTELWRWVWDKVLSPVINGIKAVWSWVYDYILKPVFEGIKRDWQNLLQALRVIWDTIKAAWDAIISAFSSVFNGIISGFNSVVTFFETTFQKIYDTILKPFVDAISSVWSAIDENIFKPLKSAFESLGNTLNSWLESLSKTWSGLMDGLNGAWQKVMDFFGSIGEKISKSLGLSNFDDFAKNIGEKIAGFFKGGLSGIATTIANSFSDAFSAIGNLASKMFSFEMKGKGKVENALGIDVPFANFGYGGIVGSIQKGAAAVGDSLKNDIVPALLSPGEAVIPRSLMNNPMVSGIVGAILTGDIQQMWNEVIKKLYDNLFDMITSSAGNFAYGGIVGDIAPIGKKFDFSGLSGRMNKTEIINYDINLTMNLEPTNTELDGAYVRNKLMPAIKDELKKSSLKGDFILANRGIRNV